MSKTYGEILFESQGGTGWASQSEAVRTLFETRAKDLILEFVRRVEEKKEELLNDPSFYAKWHRDTEEQALIHALSTELKEAK